MDGGAGHAGVKQFLGLFVTRALGLTLEDAVHGAKPVPTPELSNRLLAEAGTLVHAAWKTDRGTIKICGTYDGAQSQRVGAHVLYLEWCIGSATHHAGWWRSSIKHPGEWTRGCGTASGSAGGQPVEASQREASLDAA